MVGKYVIKVIDYLRENNMENFKSYLSEDIRAELIKRGFKQYEDDKYEYLSLRNLKSNFSEEFQKYMFGIFDKYKFDNDTIKFILDKFLPDNEDGFDFDDFEKRIEFLSTILNKDLVDKIKFNYRAVILLSSRLEYIQKIKEFYGVNGFIEILLNKDLVNTFNELEDVFTKPVLYLSKEIFEIFEQRISVPVTADEGLENEFDELKDVLKTTGIDKLALGFVNKIHFNKPNSDDETINSANHETGNIEVSVSGRFRKQIIQVLLHEIGHMVEHKMSFEEENYEIFDTYLISTLQYGTESSNYANAYKLVDGKNIKNKNNTKYQNLRYLKESFAEDFRLFFLKPELLRPEKVQVFKEICKRYYSDLDIEEIRKKIRLVLGNYYGLSVNESLKQTNCTTVLRYTKLIDEI